MVLLIFVDISTKRMQHIHCRSIESAHTYMNSVYRLYRVPLTFKVVEEFIKYNLKIK